MSFKRRNVSDLTCGADNMCRHPGVMCGMCIRCGKSSVEIESSSVSFGYIHRDFRLAYDEVVRLREKDLNNNLIHHKKLYLVLDLDHTLLNSTRLSDISSEEQENLLKDAALKSLFRLDTIDMMTKLRPYVHEFLKEANELFEMYIYTMGERDYARAMAKLLDPRNVYFNSRVIARGDSTRRHRKDLDIVLGKESAVVILDDTQKVWRKHKENLILMERYHFFASLSERKADESHESGALATVLTLLKRIHATFFDQKRKDNLVERVVREVLKEVWNEILEQV